MTPADPVSGQSATTLRLNASTASLRVHAGVFAGDAVITDGRAGALVYGPYWRLKRGRYRLRCVYRFLAPDPASRQAELHVWHAAGVFKVGSLALLEDGATALEFDLLEDVEDIEFVVMVDVRTRLAFLHFDLIPLNPDDDPQQGPLRRRDFGYNQPFRHAVSLGTHCYSAALFQRMGWKRFSGPFDWIFSTPAMVRHCIEDDFATLLDRSFFEPTPIAERPDPHHYKCQHRFYRERFGVEHVFNHHEVWTEDGHRYLERCVRRFLDIAQSGEPVLFLQTCWAEPDAVEQFEATLDLLTRRCRGAAVIGVSIARLLSQGVCPDLSVLRRDGASALLHMTPTSPWNATEFHDPLDELALCRLLELHRVQIEPPHLGRAPASMS